MTKQSKGLLKFVIIGSAVMFGLTAVLLAIQNERQKNSVSIEVNPETVELVQLEEPKEGDDIAIVETSIGEFRFVLYPEYSPNAVKNFTELAQQGYYDGTYVFQSESGAYSAMGCPQKSGEMPEGYDVSRELVERELNQNLWPFKGAVVSLNTTVDRTFAQKILGGGTYFNGSRFAVINTIEFTDEIKSGMQTDENSEKISNAFFERGGVPNFSQQMTVIGQVYDGMETVEKLSQLETENNGVYKVPKEDIMIVSVRTDKYGAGLETSENTSE